MHQISRTGVLCVPSPLEVCSPYLVSPWSVHIGVVRERLLRQLYIPSEGCDREHLLNITPATAPRSEASSQSVMRSG